MDREQALDAALGQIERAFGKGAVMKMNDRAAVSVGAVSTGSLSLDLALGIGGLPRGRIVEVFGPESSGKTTLVYHVIAEAQRRGGICAFIDAEHAMDPAYAKRIGPKASAPPTAAAIPSTSVAGVEPRNAVVTWRWSRGTILPRERCRSCHGTSASRISSGSRRAQKSLSRSSPVTLPRGLTRNRHDFVARGAAPGGEP